MSEYVVVQKGFHGEERLVYGPTSVKANAEKVAKEHPARRLVEKK